MELQENIKLSQFTTFKIGGPARYFCDPKNQDEIIEAVNMAQKMGLPFFILGGGSNILIGDEGYDGVVIKIKYQFCHPESREAGEGSRLLSECVICIESGVSLKDLVDYCMENGLSGLEWAAGIPGTVGGAIRGNAGAYNGQMSDIAISVCVCRGGALRPPSSENKETEKQRNSSSPSLRVEETEETRNQKSEIDYFDKNNCNFSYRDSIFKQNPNLIILSATLKLQQGSKEEIKRKIREILEKRGKSLGKCYPSAGCVFKNPQTDNDELIKMFETEKHVKVRDGKIPAGYLIEKLGLKGAQIGGAVVSKNNANFILNENNATARDVLDVIGLIKSRVKREFWIELELEIQII